MLGPASVRSDGVFPRVDATGWPLVPPTQITIHRTSTLDEQTRQIICALDGRRFGQVLYGETLTCEISPGQHTLRVHNTLVWKTLFFDVEPGGHVHFTVWNKALFGYFAMLAFLGSTPLGMGVAEGPPGSEHVDASARASRPWCKSPCIRRAMHAVWRRCSALKYWPYSRVVAPGQPGASPASVRRGTCTKGCQR